MSALFSSDSDDRQFAVEKILEKRTLEAEMDDDNIRVFQAPEKLNFEANTLRDLLPQSEWNRIQYTSPPILSDISDDQIRTVLNGGSLSGMVVTAPCHSQSVERAVKFMTEAVGQFAEHSKQRGYILNKKRAFRRCQSLSRKRIIQELNKIKIFHYTNKNYPAVGKN